MNKLKLLDTFAGIGGFSYAAEKLVGGFKTVQFIEIDPYCQQILNKNFPNIPIHDDITTYRAEPYSADVICGGFPCTDISVAGRQEGITETTRSGLFFQLITTIRMVRPKYVILENVSAILANGMDIVLGELYKAGYDAEWCCIPSSFVGACHQRDRWWLIAYPIGIRSRSQSKIQTGRDSTSSCGGSGDVTDSDNNGSSWTAESRSTKETDGGSEEREDIIIKSEGSSKSTDSRNVQLFSSNTKSIGHGRGDDKGCEIQERQFLSGEQKGGEVWNQTKGCGIDSPNTKGGKRNGDETQQGDGKPRTQEISRNRNSSQSSYTWRSTEHRLNPNWREYISQPTICRGDDGLSTKLDVKQRIQRLKMLGNSIVPQVCAIPLQRVIQLEREQ
tara:strand:+ start:3402 stop:4568 length:1167 start_codon:yes stop_codon:yes gene_type:complete